MPEIYDSEQRMMVPNHEMSVDDVVGNMRYAIDPVFPDNVPSKYLKTVPGQVTLDDDRVVDTGIVTEMDQAGKDVVDANELATAKADRRQQLRWEAKRYFATRYTPEEQEWFQTLFMAAFGSGKTNRRAHIQSWLEWVETGVQQARDKIVSVGSATTVAEVAAITLDTASLDTADPGISLGSVLAITD